jgi:phosphopantetheinyl transferase
VLCKGERVEDIDQLLTVWTKKESVYKQRGKGGFLPHLIQAEGKSFQTKIGGEEYRISLIKEGDCPVQFFLFDGKEAKGLEVEEI